MAEVELLGIDVLLRIDGHVRPLAQVAPFFRREPDPGGRGYFLKFEGPRAERIFIDVPSGRFKPPPEDLARRVLSSLDLFLVSRFAREDVVMFLQTVDDLLVERGRIHISGVCAPIRARLIDDGGPDATL